MTWVEFMGDKNASRPKHRWVSPVTEVGRSSHRISQRPRRLTEITVAGGALVEVYETRLTWPPANNLTSAIAICTAASAWSWETFRGTSSSSVP